MTIRHITHAVFFLALNFTAGCNGGGLAGDWGGELSYDGDELEVEFDLEVEGDEDYSGSGESEWICTVSYGGSDYWDYCTLAFSLSVETAGASGKQEVDVELEDCELRYDGERYDTACPEDFKLDWDGADNLEGDLDDGLSIDLERS